MDTTAIILKRAASAAAGLAASVLAPVIPYAAVCTAMVTADCISACALSRRLARKSSAQSDLGKISSKRLGRTITSLAKIYGALALAQMVQTVILDGVQISCVKFVAGAVCFWQAWSILENEASCNDARWARIAQRILVDKASRHIGTPLDELVAKEDKH